MKNADAAIKRHSQKRDLVIEMLKSTNEHPCAYEVHRVVSEKAPDISLGTVYRNLKQLEQAGLIRRIVTDRGIEHYDYDLKDHHHFVCERCGGVFDVETHGAVIPEGELEVRRTEVLFYGLCLKCKACGKAYTEE